MMFRFATAILLLLAGWGVSAWIRAGYSMEEIIPPPRNLHALPQQTDGWSSEDIQPDPRITGFLEAIASVDRRYRRATGEQVLLHAVWTSDYVKVHFPEQCYRENGWSQTDSREIAIPLGEDASFPARLLTFERDRQRVHVLYWFQLGDRVFLGRAEHRLLRRELCWGRKQWPPLVKVMLHTSIANPETARKQLTEFADFVGRWTHDR